MDEIHLDVEPHTFSNWDTHKEALLHLYVKLLRYTRQQCDKLGLKLSVSVPMHYDPILDQVNQLAHNTYIMAYGQADPLKLQERLAVEWNALSATSRIIALRPQDFDDINEMNRFMNTFEQTFGRTSFALHHLGSLPLKTEPNP
jgi:hypothetical protein